jgi:hypothetical protein
LTAWVNTRHSKMKPKIDWQTIRATIEGAYTEHDTPADYTTALAVSSYLCIQFGRTPEEASALSVRAGSGTFVPGCLMQTSAARHIRRVISRLRSTLPTEARDAVGARIHNWRRTLRDHQNHEPANNVRHRIEREALRPNADWSFAQSNRDRKLYAYSHAIGLEFECVGSIGRKDLIERLPIWTRVVSDGSIRTAAGQNGHEVRALLDRQTAEPRLHRLCKILSNAGLSVNRSTGLHVHLDARNIPTEAEAVRVARLMDAWIFALRELVPASRRENSYCKFGVSTRDRYRAVNVIAWSNQRTIEIRLHSGTIDYTKTLAWIRLLETIRAVARKPKAATSCLATLDQLPLTDYERAYWRGRHQQLNPSLYTTTTPTATTETE